MPQTPSDKREGEQKVPKPGGKLDKYKWYIIGGLALLAVLVFYFVNKSKANASATGAGTSSLASMGIDPATGVPFAQEYANSYGGGMGGYGFPGGGFGMTGPAGPAGRRGKIGKRGKTGKTGPRGKTGSRGKTGKHGSAMMGATGGLDSALRNANARSNWNTRIVPHVNQHTHAV